MLNKGFFKTLFGFSVIVLFGMIVFSLASGYWYDDTQENESINAEVLSE